MILDQFKLSGKVALVSGAGTGIGQGICMGLAEAGADIIGVDYKDLGETQAKIETTGRKFIGITANLTSIEPIPGILHQALRHFGHVDILVNNAGIVRRASALDFTEKDWDEVMNHNVKTVFFCSQAVAKQFIKQGTGGKIINIASIHSFHGGIQLSSFTASKSGILGLTRVMANEWAKHNININAIAPGHMAGHDSAPFHMDDSPSEPDILSRIPAGRFGIPDDLKGAVVFLASQASQYVNGFTLAIDGGWLAR
jgi:2-deoxy-D-gluconate 3-dehydrogenase